MRRLFRNEEPSLAPGLDVGALAPLVDMMTLLLVFLLRSYATEAAPAPPTGDFQLAGTVSEASRQGAVEILVSETAIWVDGRPIANLATLDGELLVRPLYDVLLKTRGADRVEVFADEHVKYGILKRVLYTARAAEYDAISLVAANRGSL